MKRILFGLSAMLLVFIGFVTSSFFTPLVKDKVNFKLTYITIGFGQNTFEMQPVFKVNGTKFVYTFEDVWITPGQKKIQRDTLLTGDFRITSIDSILNLIKEIKDTVIRKTNMHFTGGSEKYISILADQKKISFQLLNTSDTTATKIITILNSYMSGKNEILQSMKYRE